jgi:hypothetical protein
MAIIFPTFTPAFHRPLCTLNRENRQNEQGIRRRIDQAIQDLEKEGRIVKTGEYGATGKALLSRSM